MPSDPLPLPPCPSPSLPPRARLPRRSQPRVHGQGECPRGCCRRGPSQKWHFSAFLGLFSRPPAPHPRCSPVESLVEGARLWEESLRFVNISRDCWGGRRGRWGGRRRWPSPRRVLRGHWRIISQVTARGDFLRSPRGTPASRGEGGGKRGDLFPLSGDLVRSGFFSSVLFKRILCHHLASPAPSQSTAPNGFCFVFTILPPTNHLSDQFYLRPPPYFPLPPPPSSKTPFSEVRHFTNHICCFSNCDF